MKKEPKAPHSLKAAILSLFCPGLGQIYLNRIGAGVLIFLLFAMGLFLTWVNSLPNESYVVSVISDEKKLMFKPNWIFQLSGFIQLVLSWIYAIVDGWIGRRGEKYD